MDTSQVNPETLESVLHKGLYFAGELLDIDGPCGGYNLQWAWSSGVRQAQQRKGEFMIRITQLKLPVAHTPEQLKKKIAKTLKCAEDTFSYEIVRQSLDARHKDDKNLSIQ